MVNPPIDPRFVLVAPNETIADIVRHAGLCATAKCYMSSTSSASSQRPDLRAAAKFHSPPT